MKDIGNLGEELTARWLECQNYNLLQRNWRCRWGEIDIIAQDRKDKTVIFVEVKTRRQYNWDEGGLLAVDLTKQEKIIKTASWFLAKYPQLEELPCRFDVALVGYIAQIAQTPLWVADRDRRKDSKKREAKIDLREIVRVDIGQPAVIGQYRVTLENYLQSAFELS